jgi:putative endonuclease
MLAWLKNWWAGFRAREVDTNRARGLAGERAAEKFLRRELGFRVVARNWRSPRDRRDEIDLVCRDEDVLVFVEVKARAAGALVGGYDAIDARKKTALRRAISAYLRALAPRARPTTARFDVVEVEHGGGAEPEVRHFENVPLFERGFPL